MSDSESENEQRITLEDLEGSDTEMLSGDEDGPMDILTQQRVTINNEVIYTYLQPGAMEQDAWQLKTAAPWHKILPV